jgi:hypothetical protein
VHPMGSDRFYSGRLDPPTADYAERDTYKPNMGSIASQAQYSSELEEDALVAKRGLLARLWTTVRRSVWG